MSRQLVSYAELPSHKCIKSSYHYNCSYTGVFIINPCFFELTSRHLYVFFEATATRQLG
jgi:hypothetical protein